MKNSYLYFAVIILSPVFFWPMVFVWASDRGLIGDLGGHGLGGLFALIGAAVLGAVNGGILSFLTRKTKPQPVFYVELTLLVASAVFWGRALI